MFSTIRKYCRKPLVFVYSKMAHAKTSGAAYGVLSEDPPVIYAAVGGNSEEQYRVSNQSLVSLFDGLAKRPAFFLYTRPWHSEEKLHAEIVKQFEESHSRKYPKHRFIHLCNTPQQERVFRKEGLHAEFMNQNCLVDERIFRPLPSVMKIYDAVYDARLKKYKRHHLAKNLQSLALIYDYNRVVDKPEDMKAAKEALPNAHYFNHGIDGSYQRLSAEAVNHALNACKVGLCLSQREGAMHASIQYLLCGLPIVSTRSQGGRDVFFDDAYVEIVDDDPESVRKGIVQILRKDLSPIWIREQTLRKMNEHRKKLQAIVQRIYEAEGVKRDFMQEWKGIYFNKLLKWQYPNETIKQFAGV